MTRASCASRASCSGFARLAAIRSIAPMPRAGRSAWPSSRSTQHAQISTSVAGFAVAVPVAVYLVGTWLLHDVPRSMPAWRMALSPVAAVLVLLAPLTPTPVLVIGVIVVVLLAVRMATAETSRSAARSRRQRRQLAMDLGRTCGMRGARRVRGVGDERAVRTTRDGRSFPAGPNHSSRSVKWLRMGARPTSAGAGRVRSSRVSASSMGTRCRTTGKTATNSPSLAGDR
jgi:hypothetical protein